ncbi:MAG: hypothetical protein J7K40_06450 [candidate division Zixibacteria bacterium]|nr:hypothetical protein [candidate division Zixibacteria bacterium]
MASSGHRYTREELIDFLWKLTDELGYAPRTTHLKPGDPNRGTFTRRFGVKTWEEVIDAAGLTSMVIDPELPYGEIKRLPWTRETVVDFYRRIIHTEGVLPTAHGYPTLYQRRKKFFPGESSEQDVVEAAGFDYRSVRKMSKEIRRKQRIKIHTSIGNRMDVSR